ncbi:hypothetical protein FO519_002995 [Halicephalobus sp. NKZ332]|nr:hypothetical protein FO519_002995 [Halicephalobus sp. NKZ332]
MAPRLGNMDVEQLKVPLGFIKIIEFVMALIVYVSLNGWRFDYHLKCDETGVDDIRDETNTFALPDIWIKNCSSDKKVQLFDTSYRFSASMVSLISIISIMYSLAMLFIYLYRWNAYTSDDNLPRMDTAITIVIACCWFIVFWSWWRQTSSLENYTSKENVLSRAVETKLCASTKDCGLDTYAMYAPLSVSVVAAMGCALLFAYNIWITYKETIWFRQRQMNQVPHTIETHTLG